MKILSLAISCLLFACSSMMGSSQPNIILILLDDVSPDMFSCYAPFAPKGFDHAAKTPNIDRLAEQGVMFKTCYATAMCAPSRVELMTGRYGTATGVLQNGMWTTERSKYFMEDFPTLGRFMKDAGYATAIAGKWHEGVIDPYSDEGGFDEYCIWSGLKKLEKVAGFIEWNGGYENEETTSRYWHPALIQNGEILDTKPDDYGPDLCNKFLMDFMERKSSEGQPFFAYWPCVAPHGTRKGMPTNPLRGEVGDLGPAKGKEGAARFKSLNEYIDLLVGRTVDKVNELGIADNTIIILTSDNGTAVTAKTRGVERGVHVMNVIAGAGVESRGATDALTDFTDIAPTLAELANAPLPKGYAFDGQSLVPFLRGEKDDHREWIYSYISTSQLVRTRNYLLEAVNPFLGMPEGRFLFTGSNRFGKGYIRSEDLVEHASGKKALLKVLEQFPAVTEEHPFWNTRPGKRFRKAYTSPSSVEKHLHNHRDWVFYPED